MKKAIACLLLAGMAYARAQVQESPVRLKPMAPDADPSFDIVTIMLSSPEDPRSPMIQIQNRRLLTRNKSVTDLIAFGYSMIPSEIVNGPDWLQTKYDIVAQPGGEGQPNQHQWQIMMQKLLADRFGLAFHHEKKEARIYALIVGKGGPKFLVSSTGDPKGLPNLAMPARGRFRARNATMQDFVGELQGTLDRTVIDQTGIAGRYDFALSWTADDFQNARLGAFPVPRQNGDVPDLFTAIQEQLGLKLQSTRGLVDVMVIDRINKPSEN